MTTATSSSTTTTSTGSSHKRRPAQAVLIFVVAIASVVGLNVNATSALSWYAWDSPGNVAMTPYVTANGATRQIAVNQAVAGKSPQYAQYDQYVCFTSHLWEIVYSPAFSPPKPFWKEVNNDQACGWMRGSTSSITYWGKSFPAGYRKGYSMTVDVTWQLSNGLSIGSKRIGFDSAQDFWCVNGNCLVSATNWGGFFVMFPDY